MITYAEVSKRVNVEIKEGKSKKAIFESLKHDYTKYDKLIEVIRFSVTTKQKKENLFYNVILMGLLVFSIIINTLGLVNKDINPISIVNIIISCALLYGLFQFKKWAYDFVIWFGIIVIILLIVTSLDVKFDLLKFSLTLVSVLLGSYLKGCLFPKPIKKIQKNVDGGEELLVNFKD